MQSLVRYFIILLFALLIQLLPIQLSETPLTLSKSGLAPAGVVTKDSSSLPLPGEKVQLGPETCWADQDLYRNNKNNPC